MNTLNITNNWNKNKWIKTDDFQWCHQIDENIFEFYQITEEEDYQTGEKCWDVHYSEVDISDFIEVKDDDNYEHIVWCLRTYGYGIDCMPSDFCSLKQEMEYCIGDIKEIYKEGYRQIIAECIFETFFLETREAWASRHETLKEAKDKIKKATMDKN